MAKINPALTVHIAARISSLRRKMRQKALTAFLATDPADVGYLSGFTGDDSYLLLTSRNALLITDSRFTEQARRECTRTRLIRRSEPMDKAVARLTKRLPNARIGFEPDSITLLVHQQLRKALAPARLVPAKGLLRLSRMRKDPCEIRAIRRALKVAQDSFLDLLAWIRPGMTELEVTARLEMEMKIRGSSQPAFPTIIACGARTSMPHIQPGFRRIAPAKPILVDWGATVGSYKCDLTRAFFIDNMPQSFRTVYQTVRRASSAALKAIRPGVPAKQVDLAARTVIQQAGFGKYFGHSLGHGIGRDVHEPPVVGPKSTERLQEGMVFTVEPGIYLPGKGGIRIENDVLVTDRGPRVLSSLPDDPDWAVKKARPLRS